MPYHDGMIQTLQLEASDFHPDDADSWMGATIRERLGTDYDPDDVGEIQNALKGWYWRICIPGCMPDSDAHGPFKSERAAVEAARSSMD